MHAATNLGELRLTALMNQIASFTATLKGSDGLNIINQITK